MRIADSNLMMSSLRQFAAQTTREESLKAWIGTRRPNFEAYPADLLGGQSNSSAGVSASMQRQETRSTDEVSLGPPGGWVQGAALSGPALAHAVGGSLSQLPVIPRRSEESPNQSPGANQIGRSIHSSAEQSKTSHMKLAPDEALGEGYEGLDAEMRMLVILLERMTGHKFKINGTSDGVETEQPQCEAAKNTQPSQPEQPSAPTRQGWGAEYDLRESYVESEKTIFAASGIVKTADGKDTRFELNLDMSREFRIERSEQIRAGDATLDPLVINFDGTAAQLTQSKFEFDLNADGKLEQISGTGKSSGFLTLDLNGDGKVGDGRELFGPTTGDGFAELAQYDADHNGWIDENDPVYSRLRVWQGRAEEGGALATLKQKGVGAIYLGHQETQFSVNDTQNRLQGQIVSSGVYLNENGSAGSVQQVNLAI